MPNSNIDDKILVAVLQEKIDTLEEAVKSLQEDRDSALKWGIMVLGTAVLGMASWAWSHLSELLTVIK